MKKKRCFSFFNIQLTSLLIVVSATLFAQQKTQNFDNQMINHVTYSTTDTLLKNLFDLAERKAADNVRFFSPNYTVLVEGGEYPFVWLETQPMGGVMYAKRNLQVAHDNISIFLENQLKSGRIPGMIIPMNNNIWNLKDLQITDHGNLGVFSETLQGFFVPGPALELYFLLDRDSAYLNLISRSFEAYDTYLWKYRDSDGDGCLESWCQTDAGEDFLLRYDFAPFVWPFDYPPVESKIPDDSIFLKKYWTASQYKNYTHDKNPMPVESIDVLFIYLQRRFGKNFFYKTRWERSFLAKKGR